MVTLTAKNRLSVKDRKRVNKQIHVFTKPIYFDTIPLDGLFSILQNEGIVVIMEDNREWQGFLCGESADVNFVLADQTKPETPDWGSEFTVYNHVIENVELRLTWYRMPSGRYEIVAYLT